MAIKQIFQTRTSIIASSILVYLDSMRSLTTGDNAALKTVTLTPDDLRSKAYTIRTINIRCTTDVSTAGNQRTITIYLNGTSIKSIVVDGDTPATQDVSVSIEVNPFTNNKVDIGVTASGGISTQVWDFTITGVLAEWYG